jgi:hypothetical protein
LGLGFRAGVAQPLGRLAGVGQSGGEIAGHDLQPADVEPELRELPPLIVAQGPIPPLHLLDQPPLVVIPVRDTVADGQVPVQEPELIRQPQHVGVDVEHRVARLDGHAFEVGQPVQGFLQRLRLPLLDHGQEGEAILKSPVERAQPAVAIEHWLKTEPRSAEAHYLRARLAWGRSDFRSALEELTQARALGYQPQAMAGLRGLLMARELTSFLRLSRSCSKHLKALENSTPTLPTP